MIRHIPRIALLIPALAVAGQASAHGDGRGYYGPGPLLGAATLVIATLEAGLRASLPH
ncbi:hypothetical protein NVV94_09015 [Pseudomonas sp. LS1212]|uniref:hypothetical protein n=1 Tax=Pseudomonas sp. LS1212 TaxID=2972478 RepID=UPI00215BF583|nr:hypothetical protein [Pseudomonas sp. LS1212]UVJ46699.1 hypothetical protein NVV94_09015 [Pseudomonas sp. LS1212]